MTGTFTQPFVGTAPSVSVLCGEDTKGGCRLLRLFGHNFQVFEQLAYWQRLSGFIINIHGKDLQQKKGKVPHGYYFTVAATVLKGRYFLQSYNPLANNPVT